MKTSEIGGEHRELMKECRSVDGQKMWFDFQKLPEDLQDQIIAGLDDGTLNYNSASQLTKDAGCSLGPISISRYHKVLRLQRGVHDFGYWSMAILQASTEIKGVDALQALANMSTVALIKIISNSETKIPPNLIPKYIDAIANLYQVLGTLKYSNSNSARVVDAEKLRKRIGEEVYGIAS